MMKYGVSMEYNTLMNLWLLNEFCEAKAFGNLTNKQCEEYDGFDFVMMMLCMIMSWFVRSAYNVY